MSAGRTFVDDLPVADIRIGTSQYIRIYGEPAASVRVPLVEMRLFRKGFEDVLNLTVEQAEAMALGLAKAVMKARGIAE